MRIHVHLPSNKIALNDKIKYDEQQKQQQKDDATLFKCIVLSIITFLEGEFYFIFAIDSETYNRIAVLIILNVATLYTISIIKFIKIEIITNEKRSGDNHFFFKHQIVNVSFEIIDKIKYYSDWILYTMIWISLIILGMSLNHERLLY